MSLVIIGEAATNIIEHYTSFTAKYSEVSWRSMRGMRNCLAHGYFEIDLEVVWETVQTALPAFLKIVPSLREDTDPGPSIPSRTDSR